MGTHRDGEAPRGQWRWEVITTLRQGGRRRNNGTVAQGKLQRRGRLVEVKSCKVRDRTRAERIGKRWEEIT